MPEPDLIELFVRPLNALRIRYLITGSVASMLYGEPRVTHDIDLIIFATLRDLTGLETVFPIKDFYLPPHSVLLTEMERHQDGHFNVIHLESGLKADFFFSGRDELHVWAIQNARQYEMNGMRIFVAAPEYVILRKLQYFQLGQSEKHLRDIRAMKMVSGATINEVVLLEWVKKLGVEAEWSRTLA